MTHLQSPDAHPRESGPDSLVAKKIAAAQVPDIVGGPYYLGTICVLLRLRKQKWVVCRVLLYMRATILIAQITAINTYHSWTLFVSDDDGEKLVLAAGRGDVTDCIRQLPNIFYTLKHSFTINETCLSICKHGDNFNSKMSCRLFFWCLLFF